MQRASLASHSTHAQASSAAYVQSLMQPPQPSQRVSLAAVSLATLPTVTRATLAMVLLLVYARVREERFVSHGALLLALGVGFALMAHTHGLRSGFTLLLALYLVTPLLREQKAGLPAERLSFVFLCSYVASGGDAGEGSTLSTASALLAASALAKSVSSEAHVLLLLLVASSAALLPRSMHALWLASPLAGACASAAGAMGVVGAAAAAHGSQGAVACLACYAAIAGLGPLCVCVLQPKLRGRSGPWDEAQWEPAGGMEARDERGRGTNHIHQKSTKT